MSMMLLISALAGPASACDPLPMGTFEVAADPADTEAPLAPLLQGVAVQRGEREPVGANAGMRCWSATSGTLSFTLEQPGIDAEIDDPDAWESWQPAVGYRLEVVEGALPAELEQRMSETTWYGSPQLGQDGTYVEYLYFLWEDPPRRQESLDAVVEVVAVDRAGNEGPPLRVDVRSEAEPRVCAVAPGSLLGAPAWLLALGLVRRRRGSDRRQGR